MGIAELWDGISAIPCARDRPASDDERHKLSARDILPLLLSVTEFANYSGGRQ
jgi:hypothetical protein